MKKQLFLSIPLLLLLVGANTSCSSSTPEKKEDEKEEVITFSKIKDGEPARSIAKGETTTFNVNVDLVSDNYLKLLCKTSGKVFGTFTYHNNAKPSQVITENFFIEASNDVIDFRQFLDSFRPFNTKTNKQQSVGIDSEGNIIEKTLDSISIKNLEDSTITFELQEVDISDREIPNEKKEVYIEQDNLKVGMDLLTGGTLTYLEKTEYDGMSVDEIIDKNNQVQIGVGYADKAKTEISSHVNLINIYDAGREIQQSYYAGIGGYGLTEEERKDLENGDGGTQNGYTRNISYTADKNGYYWPYNPVQGGDEKNNFSQVIDYRKTKNELYCKVRSLDWAGGKSGGHGNPDNNRVTQSYTENWYTIKDGMLFAKNRFIDWNGFTELNTINAHNIEMPATYISHPLHVYQCYNGSKPYAEELDKTIGKNALDRQPSLGTWKNGGYQSGTHSEDWFAWTNDDDFGVGVYIPGANYYSSGRSVASTKIDAVNPENISVNAGALDSPMAAEFRYNKPKAESDYQSCYVKNTSYTAPVKAVKLKNYIPLEYEYVIAVDFVDIFRESFRDLHDNKTIQNKGLDNWND